MAEVLFDVKQGRRVYVANAAISTGMLVIPGSTAGQVGPAAATGPINMVALTDAASSAEVEVMPITRGAEYRFLAGGAVTAGSEVEFATTTGKIQTSPQVLNAGVPWKPGHPADSSRSSPTDRPQLNPH